MPSQDRLGQLFAELAGERLPVPAAERVLARGRQRRRRARLTAAVSVAAVVALGAGTASYVRQLAEQGQRTNQKPAAKHSGSKPAHLRAQSLPPPGSGPLLLGVTANGSFRMARLGHSLETVPVAGLSAGTAFQPVIATNPGGGWVVDEAVGQAGDLGWQPASLVDVSASGAVVPFGPAFGRDDRVTALAVDPSGSAVAVAIWRVEKHFDAAHPGRGVRPGLIVLVPLPGHPGTVRKWRLDSPTATQAQSLSWNGSAHLTYIPGGDETGGGFAGAGAVTLDVAAAGRVAPASPTWPLPSKAPGSCRLVAGSWVNSAGYLALEYCASVGNVLVFVNPVTGQQVSVRIRISGFGCPSPQLSPALDGRAVLVPSCQLQVYRPGRRVVRLGTSLSDAAFAG